MIRHTNTKINIGLFVTEKRKDGFHNIESIFYPVSFGDVLEVIEVEGKGCISFSVYGIDIPGQLEDNLCVKAYHLLNEDFRLPAIKSKLLKIVPIGAGLGGGSSDAVTMLLLLNDLFSIKLTNQELKKYALSLGSDCPFFVDNKPCYVAGRGELMENANVDLTGYFIVLVFPDFHVSTEEAYSSLQPKSSNFDLKNISDLAVANWKTEVINDFEKPIGKNHPEINDVVKILYRSGAEYSAMSGSGSTVYGLFKQKPSVSFGKFSFWLGKL